VLLGAVRRSLFLDAALLRRAYLRRRRRALRAGAGLVLTDLRAARRAARREHGDEAQAGGAASTEVKEPRTKGLEQRARAVPKAFEMPAPPELLS